MSNIHTALHNVLALESVLNIPVDEIFAVIKCINEVANMEHDRYVRYGDNVVVIERVGLHGNVFQRLVVFYNTFLVNSSTGPRLTPTMIFYPYYFRPKADTLTIYEHPDFTLDVLCEILDAMGFSQVKPVVPPVKTQPKIDLNVAPEILNAVEIMLRNVHRSDDIGYIRMECVNGNNGMDVIAWSDQQQGEIAVAYLHIKQNRDVAFELPGLPDTYVLGKHYGLIYQALRLWGVCIDRSMWDTFVNEIPSSI